MLTLTQYPLIAIQAVPTITTTSKARNICLTNSGLNIIPVGIPSLKSKLEIVLNLNRTLVFFHIS
ncbi:hypothetical protein DPMN_123321 [Dreissena polymorpha]|uniref:Uncharacterized protein n=1 Tax=Dreissena polymorpha TaxID=45954 RepID=A0A9D4JV91_DREPO|nr:hypothetical protein DPMN_123321 [Dreissena polymorpha]